MTSISASTKRHFNALDKLFARANYDLSEFHGSEFKDEYHRIGKLALKRLAGDLGLHSSEYDIRSNRGGIAVGGEVTLHTDNIYIQINSGMMCKHQPVMYRECDGRKDYTGKRNNFSCFKNGPQEILQFFKEKV